MSQELTATGRIEVAMEPADSLTQGTGRLDVTRTWSGEVTGTSRGVMLTAGDPSAGAAGYVSMETFEGTIDGREGTLALQQFGSVQHGQVLMRYTVAPGSGTGALAGFTGQVDVTSGSGPVQQVTLRLRQERASA